MHQAAEPFYQGHMTSIREDKARALCEEKLIDFTAFNAQFFTRIYPRAT